MYNTGESQIAKETVLCAYRTIVVCTVLLQWDTAVAYTEIYYFR